VGGIADDGLIEVTNLYFDLARCIGDGTQIADVAVSADPRPAARQEAIRASPLPAIRKTSRYFRARSNEPNAPS
jgi:hypothetical protein